MLAAGLLAAGTILTTAGEDSVSATTAHRRGCSPSGSTHLNVMSKGVNYYRGTPNTTSAGAVVRLKPRANSTTDWTFCFVSGDEFAIYNRNLVLSATRTTDANVTMEHPGNFGDGFALQRWHVIFPSTGGVTMTNVRTGQFLRVRNSGPTMNQTVTTGFASTTWLFG
jgi:hypothetical protein